MTRVLVVDDEPQLRRALDVNLRIRDYEVSLAETGRQALELAASGHPDVVILDLGLPDIDGVQVIEGLRGWTDVPIIILSVRDAEADKIAALDAGADDYVTKPFSIAELLARLRANVRRLAAGQDRQAVVETDDFRIDLAAKQVTKGRDPIHLTRTEWSLVEVLVSAADRLVTHRQLRQSVWGTSEHFDPNLLHVHVANIRRKLEPAPTTPRYFVNEPGMGYRFTPRAGPEQD